MQSVLWGPNSLPGQYSTEFLQSRLYQGLSPSTLKVPLLKTTNLYSGLPWGGTLWFLIFCTVPGSWGHATDHASLPGTSLWRKSSSMFVCFSSRNKGNLSQPLVQTSTIVWRYGYWRSHRVSHDRALSFFERELNQVTYFQNKLSNMVSLKVTLISVYPIYILWKLAKHLRHKATKHWIKMYLVFCVHAGL